VTRFATSLALAWALSLSACQAEPLPASSPAEEDAPPPSSAPAAAPEEAAAPPAAGGAPGQPVAPAQGAGGPVLMQGDGFNLRLSVGSPQASPRPPTPPQGASEGVSPTPTPRMPE